MRARRSWLLWLVVVACGPATNDPGTDDGTSPSTSASPSTSSGGVDASGPASTAADSTSTGTVPIDCAALDVDACEAEPACEPLWAQTELEIACVGAPFFAGCQPVDCPGSPCWICEDLSVDPRNWAPNCGCLPEPWDACGGDANAPAQVEQCECAEDVDCPESWQICRDGFCVACTDMFMQCSCMRVGCAPGFCCLSYCIPGEPMPDGICMPR